MKTEQELVTHFADRLESVNQLVQDAYKLGYEEAKQKFQHVINVDKVRYFDLGLPSGTLWSRPLHLINFGFQLQLRAYSDVQNLNLPTAEQWKELMTHCVCKNHSTYGAEIIGPNGVRTGYEWSETSNIIYTLGEGCETGRNKFWVKSDVDEHHMANVVVFDKDVFEFDHHFSGYTLPFFLVKNK